MLLVAEVVFAALVAAGVGMIYLPAGVIVAGLLGVLACEYSASRRRLQAAADRPVSPERIS